MRIGNLIAHHSKSVFIDDNMTNYRAAKYIQ